MNTTPSGVSWGEVAPRVGGGDDDGGRVAGGLAGEAGDQLEVVDNERRDRVFEVLSTTEGQRGFWTANCEVSADRARFGFAQAPVDLEVAVSAEPGKLVRMRVTSGFPFWEGSTFEWELGPATRAQSGTGVLFRHYGFADGYPESDLGHTAHLGDGAGPAREVRRERHPAAVVPRDQLVRHP